MGFAAIKEKARELFDEASFISHINNDNDYQQALALMDELIEDYDNQRALIAVLSVSIEQWENTAPEFSAFNDRVANINDDLALLKVLMEQHGLGVADLPEIGTKSLVSRILSGDRSLTKKHIETLSQRFGISPALFFG